MVARVSLGHTGRVLKVNKLISFAFLLITLGALIRAFLPYFVGLHFASVSSAILWITSFTLFSFSYFNVLTRKRVDGRRG
jgi:uncharacterized protein involved in response to NO